LLPGLVRSGSVVMEQVLAEHQGQVAFAENQDPVQELTAEGSDDPSADAPRSDSPAPSGESAS
jgi:hypothetical protein